jgi:hypothetical protein
MLTFETNCYENDWEFILKGNYLQQMIARCNYTFSQRVVMINNVQNKKKSVIVRIKKSDRVLLMHTIWDKEFLLSKEESFDNIDDFFLGFGFSDQCYLIRTKDFRQPIYNEHHEVSARFPEYGGELFEKRVDSHMRNHNLYRITSKKNSYMHNNFPKGGSERFRLKWNLFFNCE